MTEITTYCQAVASATCESCPLRQLDEPTLEALAAPGVTPDEVADGFAGVVESMDRIAAAAGDEYAACTDDQYDGTTQHPTGDLYAEAAQFPTGDMFAEAVELHDGDMSVTIEDDKAATVDAMVSTLSQHMTPHTFHERDAAAVDELEDGLTTCAEHKLGALCLSNSATAVEASGPAAAEQLDVFARLAGDTSLAIHTLRSLAQIGSPTAVRDMIGRIHEILPSVERQVMIRPEELDLDLAAGFVSSPDATNRAMLMRAAVLLEALQDRRQA
jgi:hypothetical protein